MRVLNTLLIDAATVALLQASAGIKLDHLICADLMAAIAGANVASKTFDTGSYAALVVQDLTYTADVPGVAGNAITVAYTIGGTAGAEVVTVVGSAISVQIQTAVSTATEVKAAIDASVPASALISVAVSGTGATAQVAVAAAPLAGGTASEVDPTANSVTIPSHGYTTGAKCQLTTTGTLPAGLSTGTDYYLIVVDANTLKFATTQALALAGTPVDITGYGTDDAVHTVAIVTTLAGTVKLQKNDEPEDAAENWLDVTSSSQAFSGATTLNWTLTDIGYREIRAVVTTTSGTVTASVRLNAKGV